MGGTMVHHLRGYAVRAVWGLQRCAADI